VIRASRIVNKTVREWRDAALLVWRVSRSHVGIELAAPRVAKLRLVLDPPDAAQLARDLVERMPEEELLRRLGSPEAVRDLMGALEALAADPAAVVSSEL